MLDSIKNRWARLDHLTSVRRLVSKKEPEHDERKERVSELERFVNHSEFESAFLPWLRERVEQLEFEMEESIHSHPDLCAIQGKKQEIRRIISELEKLRTGE